MEVSTLRFYERRGLLLPAGRTPGGYRTYPGDAPRTVRFIRRAQQLGFTLAEISAVLELRAAAGDVAPDVVAEHVAAKIAEVDRRIADLTRMRAALTLLSTEGVDPDAPCPVVGSLGDVPAGGVAG
ncbi:hypothetical protein NUM3379_26880 [Kineococcus sp. NUM-3379]